MTVMSKTSTLVVAAAAVLLLAFTAIGLVPRLRADAKAQVAGASNQHVVTVAEVQAAPADTTLTLPGTLRAWQDTPLYARSEGYLVRLHADLGDEVKAGQLLADIDTPDLDQDLAASRAQLAQARAQLALAQSTDARYQALVKQGAVSHLEADQQMTSVQARQADVDLGVARVQRLEELTRFKRVVAPFAGRITRRQAEPGVLVGPTTPLFQLASIDRLRVQVQVPQSHMRSVTPGLTAKLALREYPGETFEGRVTRTSGSVDTARTMTAEIEFDNSKFKLPPGLYAEVGFGVTQVTPVALIPGNALIVNQRGTQVAIVNSDGTLRVSRVRVGRDMGGRVEILEGLNIGSRVVTNPSDTLRDGDSVRVAEAISPPGTAAQKPASQAARAAATG